MPDIDDLGYSRKCAGILDIGCMFDSRQTVWSPVYRDWFCSYCLDWRSRAEVDDTPSRVLPEPSVARLNYGVPFLVGVATLVGALAVLWTVFQVVTAFGG